MRKLMWFTIGFGAACAFCAYSWICEGLILPAIVFIVLFVGLLAAGKWAEQLKVAAVICLGISLGLLWFQCYCNQYLSKVSELDGKLAEVKAYCTDYSYETDYGCAVECFLYVDGKPCRAKFYLNSKADVEPGDILTGVFRLRVTTQDSENGATYHQGKGIFLMGYQREDGQLLKQEEKPLWAYPAVARRYLIQVIGNAFPSDTEGFAQALLLGDRTNISYELNTLFKTSGIMHIIAVSGLHVTILFTLIQMLCLKRRWLVAILGIPALLLFAATAGFTPSITRACIMQVLMIGAMVLNKEYDGPTELAFASLVMLAVNPLVITSVSFQLSVGCMIGIFLFQKPINDWLCAKLGCGKQHRLVKLKRWLAGSVSMSLSAISLTTPLSAYYFGAVSLVGVVTNLLTLWAVSAIFYGIIAVCVLNIWFPAAAVFCGQLVSLLIRLVLAVATWLGGLPLAAVYTCSIYVVAWLVFCYILLGLFLLVKQKNPGILAACAAFGLLISVGASWLEPRIDQCRMTVLDVGQGQCIIFQSDGKTYLVDCGGDYDTGAADVASEMLLSQGISAIDGLILTHFDRDHAGGAINLLTRMPVQSVYIPDHADTSGVRTALEEKLPDSVFIVNEQIQICFDHTAITVYPSPVPEEANEGSLAVLFQNRNCDILVTGDRNGFGERLLLKTAEIPELDVLVAGHHGSANSTCPELLEATKPTIVAISVGDNSYGHPSGEVLQRLEQYGCLVYRTDIHGNLIFRR